MLGMHLADLDVEGLRIRRVQILHNAADLLAIVGEVEEDREVSLVDADWIVTRPHMNFDRSLQGQWVVYFALHSHLEESSVHVIDCRTTASVLLNHWPFSSSEPEKPDALHWFE
jgi:hypothetical protein